LAGAYLGLFLVRLANLLDLPVAEAKALHLAADRLGCGDRSAVVALGAAPGIPLPVSSGSRPAAESGRWLPSAHADSTRSCQLRPPAP
jgi:hypothetical protein